MAWTNGEKLERCWLAHFVDENFGSSTASWKRLGEDLESYEIAMNPDVETKKNIIGENSVNVKGYDPQGSVDTYYAYAGDALFDQLRSIINHRSTGSALVTKVCDVYIDQSGTVIEAYQEDAVLVPQSLGGDTGAINIPFELYYKGNREDVTSRATLTNGVLTIAAASGNG